LEIAKKATTIISIDRESVSELDCTENEIHKKVDL